MKKLLLSLILAAVSGIAHGHEHIHVGINPENPAGLAMAAEDPNNPDQVATYFPLGESPSGYLPLFPGGAFASELSFSLENEVFDVPSPAFVRVEILAITGPEGSSISFWDVNATTATWTRPAGWTATGGDQFSFAASESNAGSGHIHGRIFTMDRPGDYTVTFRALDAYAPEPTEPPHVPFTPSAPFVVRFTAISAPRLAISKVDSDIRLTFTSRPNLSYDVQSSTTLHPDDWETIGAPLNGTGGELEFTEANADRPRVFYRLVEYP